MLAQIIALGWNNRKDRVWKHILLKILARVGSFASFCVIDLYRKNASRLQKYTHIIKVEYSVLIWDKTTIGETFGVGLRAPTNFKSLGTPLIL